MADYSIIRLAHLSPIHIGTGKENYDFSSSALQSDTLTSAIASIRAQQGKASDLTSFLNSFCMSSAFPYYKDSYFFPKPQGRISIQVHGEEEFQYRKMLKKIQFLDQSIWKDILLGKQVSIERSQIKKALVVSKEDSDLPTIAKRQVNERVTVSRFNDDSSPFFFEWKYYNQDGGLFVITDAKDALLKEIILYLEILGDQGLGTDKNIGGGKFTPEYAGVFHIEEIAEADSQLLLSPFIPTESELGSIDLEKSKYSLIKRGGFIAGSEHPEFRHLRKRSVFMFDVGSILSTQLPITGKVVDLRPDWNDDKLHPVYRSGRALSIPIKQQCI